MIKKDGGQAHGFAAKFAANGEFGVCSVVAFVKQQVERCMDGWQAGREFGWRRDVEQLF